jgi:hypothetical protein
MSDIPDSTVMTPSSDAAKRIAHEASDMSGAAPRRISDTFCGGAASIPPLTGSMMTTGLLCLRATSQHSRDFTVGAFQSA